MVNKYKYSTNYLNNKKAWKLNNTFQFGKMFRKSPTSKICTGLFTFMHLADAYIQSDLQCIQAIHFLSVCVFAGTWTHNLCAANAMLYHWATGTLFNMLTNLGKNTLQKWPCLLNKAMSLLWGKFLIVGLLSIIMKIRWIMIVKKNYNCI